MSMATDRESIRWIPANHKDRAYITARSEDGAWTIRPRGSRGSRLVAPYYVLEHNGKVVYSPAMTQQEARRVAENLQVDSTQDARNGLCLIGTTT